MDLQDFKKLLRNGVGYSEDKPLTTEQLLTWQGINFNEFLSKQTQAPPSQVTVKDQNGDVLETVNAPGQVSVFTFDGIQDLALAGNTVAIIDKPMT